MSESMDIVIEILKRVPIKSVMRFMSVSKSWKSIIQSSPFIAAYNNIEPPNHFFVGFHDRNFALIKEKTRKGKELVSNYGYYIAFQQLLTLSDSDDFVDVKNCKLIGYSQGLFGFYNDKDRLVIWNPSIRKSVPIPLPEGGCDGTDFGFTVVCDATEPTIFNVKYKPRLMVHIYTLSTAAWRIVFNPSLPRESLVITGIWVVIDRFIHWLAYDKTSTHHKLIVSFDITSEQFTELCLPPTLAKHTNLGLSKLRESLVVLEIIDVPKKEIGVWMMEPGVQNSFTKLYTVKVSAADPLIRRKPYKLDVLGFTKEDQLIILATADPRELTLLFYEHGSRRFIDIGKTGTKHSCLADSYMETLLLLDR